MLSIISTVGTSVFGRPNTPLNEALKSFAKNHQTGVEPEILKKSSFPGIDLYQEALSNLRAKTTIEFLRDSCAELNAIEGIHLEQNSLINNEYHFLASQTPAGALAARILTDYCQEKYQASKSVGYSVEGLQVEHGTDFRAKGLPNLVQRIYQLLDDAKRMQLTVVINPTGGFKAAIPYMTLVGMLRQVEGVTISCIHETSKNLITLSGLPISLNLSSIRDVLPLLHECNSAQQQGLDSARLKTALNLKPDQSIEHHPMWSLFEPFDAQHYMLSGLGSIALRELESRAKRKPVCLSKQAADAFDKLKPGKAKDHYTIILDRIGDVDNRQPPYRHEYKGSNGEAE